jgi:hypothetical protein
MMLRGQGDWPPVVRCKMGIRKLGHSLCGTTTRCSLLVPSSGQMVPHTACLEAHRSGPMFKLGGNHGFLMPATMSASLARYLT